VEFLHLNYDDCLNKRLSNFLPDASEDIGRLVNHVLIENQPQKNAEIQFFFRGSQYFWQVSVYPIKNENDISESASCIINDITELRKSEQELEKAYTEILQLQEKLKQENSFLRKEISLNVHPYEIVGSSPAIKKVLEQIKQVSQTETTVLIYGQTGTGKELVARAIHKNSTRHDKPLIIVNCAALPANLIESELFGHEKGAFTGATNRKIGKFELADQGTIFLDEVGELPLELQSKLLRVLQENQIERIGGNKLIDINTRIIAATNRNLFQEVKKSRFREDLYFRLNVFPVTLPLLKERSNDIIEIAEVWINRLSEKMGKPRPTLSEASKHALMTYSWPGNIRELKNQIERGLILCVSDTLELNLPVLAEEKSFESISPEIYQQTLAEVEKSHILQVLEQKGWKVRGDDGAAKSLGLKPTTLESKMKKLGIFRPKFF
jgi:transcriptional regulator with GAF, ATPase, and Fis domain